MGDTETVFTISSTVVSSEIVIFKGVTESVVSRRWETTSLIALAILPKEKEEGEEGEEVVEGALLVKDMLIGSLRVVLDWVVNWVVCWRKLKFSGALNICLQILIFVFSW